MRAAGVAPEQVVGIATDFTASTPLPVLADGTPLCDAFPIARTRTRSCGSTMRPSATPTASTRVAEERGEPWLARYGGRISSEWAFAKALQVLDEDPELYARMDRWIEAADWIVWQLCGHETRNVCTAGYKGIHQDGAYPAEAYLRELDERFGDLWPPSSPARSRRSARAPAR